MSKLGIILMNVEELKSADRIHKNIVDKIITNDWPPNTNVTIGFALHNVENMYKIICITDEEKLNEIEWFRIGCYSKKDLIDLKLSMIKNIQSKILNILNEKIEFKNGQL